MSESGTHSGASVDCGLDDHDALDGHFSGK